jgi:hypothetical protein
MYFIAKFYDKDLKLKLKVMDALREEQIRYRIEKDFKGIVLNISRL